MMRKLALYAAPMMLLIGFAARTCVYPQAPQNVPNGAWRRTVMAAQSSIKAYRDR
jgi:hypothetical protein